MSMNKDEKISDLKIMLECMTEYSSYIPARVDKASKEIMVSPAYFNYVTMMVESFFTVMSISVLIREALISNAIALVRILLEQVSTVCVLTNNEKAMSFYLRIKGLRDRYCNNEITIDDINKEFNTNIDKDSISRFFDYGWTLSFGPKGWGSEKIIREAKFKKVLKDKWYLNLFAHGQLSWFQIKRAGNNEAVDGYLFRAMYITGVLFFHLRNSVLKFFGEEIENNELYKIFKDAKFYFESATKEKF